MLGACSCPEPGEGRGGSATGRLTAPLRRTRTGGTAAGATFTLPPEGEIKMETPLSNQHDFYLARAAEARADAEAAVLDNVRERCLRSEAAWAEMAARAHRGDKMREKLAAEKQSVALPAMQQ